MRNSIPNLISVYKPSAIYFSESDILEYVRDDLPSVARRVDEFLTLVLAMSDRRLIGVRIKGFRYLYGKMLRNENRSINVNHIDENRFVSLTKVFEEILTNVGNDIFDQIEKKEAYEKAIEIARNDQVRVDTDQLAA